MALAKIQNTCVPRPSHSASWHNIPISLIEAEIGFAAGLNAAMAFGPPREAQDALTMIDLGGHFETTFQFSFGTVHEGPWRIGINLVAVLLFVLLWLSVRMPSKKAERP
jgi:hypothetical protein